MSSSSAGHTAYLCDQTICLKPEGHAKLQVHCSTGIYSARGELVMSLYVLTE